MMLQGFSGLLTDSHRELNLGLWLKGGFCSHERGTTIPLLSNYQLQYPATASKPSSTDHFFFKTLCKLYRYNDSNSAITKAIAVTVDAAHQAGLSGTALHLDVPVFKQEKI